MAIAPSSVAAISIFPNTSASAARRAARSCVCSRRTRCWHDTKLKQIVEDLAAEAGYQSAVALALENEAVSHSDRLNESVAGCLTRLARKYHAAANIKRGRLLFVPRGTGESVSGSIPTVAIEQALLRHGVILLG